MTSFVLTKIAPVKHAERVQQQKERQQPEVKLADDGSLFLGGILGSAALSARRLESSLELVGALFAPRTGHRPIAHGCFHLVVCSARSDETNATL